MEKGTRADCLNHRLRVGSLVNAASLHRTVAGVSEENTAPPENAPYLPWPHSPSGKARDLRVSSCSLLTQVCKAGSLVLP